MSIGIPYAQTEQLGPGGAWVKTCPVCGEQILLSQRKDEESFSGREYAWHYDRAPGHEPLKENEVWCVTWAGEDGDDVHLFRDHLDAALQFDKLCRESDVYPLLPYAAEGYDYDGYTGDAARPQDDPWAESAQTGEKQCNILGPRKVAIL